ncbi:hypothetical protein SAY86_025521 [Trapa natans]|uniref:Uncharacterized protein n=1 Tax=Trapa natans TaxID=22666 RepID=A0AAN7M8M1_TRANT|nr:hypothetical protein SAY86_025521 [Trapa natans]
MDSTVEGEPNLGFQRLEGAGSDINGGIHTRSPRKFLEQIKTARSYVHPSGSISFTIQKKKCRKMLA